MRVAPKAPSKIEKLDKPESITQVCKYELITPLFGGGVKAGEADQITTIRGSSIRGQLRFWWRACRGGAFANLEQMKKAEDAIWGTASKDKKGEKPASKVQVFVEVQKHGKAVKPFELSQQNVQGRIKLRIDLRENIAPSYAAFPLRPQKLHQNMQLKEILNDISFTLNITYPKTLQSDIEAALWAWETFGGIGARTRRGFGAISLVSIDQKPVTLPAINNFESFINQQLKKHVVDVVKWPLDLPHLSKNLVYKSTSKPNFTTANLVWSHLIRTLRDFRQERNPGSRPNRPGRSRWPEPDYIRGLTGQHTSSHSPTNKLNKFPRAAFGLPIIFQFNPDDYNRNNPYDPNFDPRTTMLTLSGNSIESDRLASPLILRPIKCSNGYVGLAAILEGTQRLLDNAQVKLKTNESTGTPQQKNEDWPNLAVKLNATEASQILKSDNKTKLLDNETDVLKAFLNKL